MQKILLVSFGMLFCAGCVPLKQSPKYQLGDGYYYFRQEGRARQRVLVFLEGDSIELFKQLDRKDRVLPQSGKQMFFTKPSTDLDVMTIPFKYRPATPSLPQQLNTDFNGNIFFGYRVDRFKVRSISTPIGTRQHIGHRGLTVGAFAGLGSTGVTPWTTDYQIADEYFGCTLTGGFSFMIGFHNHTAGLGIGWDHLAGRDKDIWIYQDKPWYGVTIGINLN